jgi:hypothetical protein
MKNLNKKGSHIGIMISFMIFITFIVFFLSIVTNKVQKEKDKQIALEYIEMRILKNTSYPLTIALVNITNNPGDNNCIELKDVFIFLNATSYGGIIKNKNEEEQTSYVDDDNIEKNLKINRTDISNNIFELILSPAYSKFRENNEITCTLKENSNGYRFSSIRKDYTYAFENEFQKLNESYFINYEKLKEDLFVPSDNEFIFEFEKSNGEIIKPSKTINARNIYSDEIPLQYIDNHGNIQSGFLRVKIW